MQIEMPMNDETNKSMGFCFVEFRTKESAHEAVDRAQGTVLPRAAACWLFGLAEPVLFP